MVSKITDFMYIYYPHIKLKAIRDLGLLDKLVNEEHYVVVYILHEDPTGVRVGKDTISWSSLALLINESHSIYHIVESCYSSNLYKYDIDNSTVFTISNVVDIDIGYYDILSKIAYLLNQTGTDEAVTASERIMARVREALIMNFKELVLKMFMPKHILAEPSDLVEVVLLKDTSFSGSAGFFTDMLVDLIRDYYGSGLITIDRKHLPSWDFSTSLGGLGSGSDEIANPWRRGVEMNIDLDLDGLDDTAEVNILGTDPLLNDTDGNGINDYNETYVYSTDPLVYDTNNDGLDSREEVDYWWSLGIDPCSDLGGNNIPSIID